MMSKQYSPPSAPRPTMTARPISPPSRPWPGCGIMVAKALDAAATLEEEGISAAVVDLFTVKPLDAELVLSYAKKTGAVVTAENHNHIGGLTSAVTALLAAKLPTPVEYVAVEDVFGEVGPQDYLEKQFGLTAEHIVSQVKAVIARK